MEPICKRCHLQGISPSQFEKTVDDYLDSLPPDLKAASDILRNRLSICARCEYLTDGICRICGCFAKARAAKQPSRCPAFNPKW